MLQVGLPRDEQLQVVRGEGRRRHPVVVGLFEGGGVVPEGVGLEVGAVGGETNLDAPVRARGQVHGPDEGAHAPVRVFAHRVVDRGGGGGGVADHPEVEFDPARGPRPPQRDVAEFHDLVAVDELVPRLLDHPSPHLPPRFGQHEHLDQVVLQLQHLPLQRHGSRGVPAEGVVGVQPAVAGQDRHGIGLRERIGVEHPDFLGDAGLGGGVGRGAGRQRSGAEEACERRRGERRAGEGGGERRRGGARRRAAGPRGLSPKHHHGRHPQLGGG